MGASARLPDGGAELCGSAFPAGEKNGPRTTAQTSRALIVGPRVLGLRASPPLPPGCGKVSPSPQVVSRSCQNECLARFIADAADHGFESVRSLWCEVLAQSEAVEQRQRVDIQNLARRLA